MLSTIIHSVFIPNLKRQMTDKLLI